MPDPVQTALVDPASARLSGSRSQRAFSVLLDTLARPGTVASLEGVALPEALPAALVLPLALADVEVSVAVVGEDAGPWQRLVGDVTGAAAAPPEHASMVAFLDRTDPDVVRGLRRGSHESPEGGAKVAVACRSLRAQPRGDAAPDEVVIEVTGPGVDGSRRLGVAGLPAAVLDAVADACSAFPTGIDTWLVTPTGEIAALSRSTRLDLADLTEVR